MSREEIRCQIIAGEHLAEKIKAVLFGQEKTMVKMAFAVGRMMCKVKDFLRPLYPYASELQFLHEIGNYSEQDVHEAIEKVGGKEAVWNIASNLPNDTCKHSAHFMATWK